MKHLFPLFLFTFSLVLPAQNRPAESMLSRMPYLDPDVASVKPGLLDIRGMLAAIPPFPDFEIPRRIPEEFLLTETERAAIERAREANRKIVEGDPDAAVAVYTELVEQIPEQLELRIGLADAHYASGNYAEAEEAYLYVLERMPMNFQCLNNLAWLYASTSPEDPVKLREAERLAVMAKVLRPDSHHLWSTLSRIHYEKGDYIQADAAITAALRRLQQGPVNRRTLVSYHIQKQRCMLAFRATTILE